MANPSDIFTKLRLTPGQWRAVAERRFGDASYLIDSGNAERATGGIYMAGFVIECLLKALLLERHPNLAKPVDPAKLSESDRSVHSLLYSHELDDMLGFLPEIEKKLGGVKTKSGDSAWRTFSTICEEWAVYARYSPRIAKLDRARQFIETIEEVKKWLKEL
ncbi:MAG: hypothetical protein WBD40_24420 [Tepidisphaeraceae bacterium]